MLKLKDVKKGKKKRALKRPDKKRTRRVTGQRQGVSIDSRPTTEVKERYRSRVREEREKAGIMKQVDLARMVGVRRQFIHQLEEQQTFLSSPMALILSEIFGCSLDDLYEKVN